MSLRKVLQADPEITAEQKRAAYLAKKNECDARAFESLDYDRKVVQVLSAVTQRGFHRWAYEIVALDSAGIYKGSANQVREAQNMIAEWEGKRDEQQREAA